MRFFRWIFGWWGSVTKPYAMAPAVRTLTAPAELRAIAPAADDRTLRIAAESREV